MSNEVHERYMRLALKEAKKGLGKTSPNPCVGAVIVKDGTIISTGYHKKAGTPHAEIHALRRAGEKACGATMYVTLEPCNHTGRTPPCSHAVARAGLALVVVGMEDPNPLVDGTGIDYLQSKGIATISGILERECRDLNRPFIKHISTGLPWMVMKAGLSLDGRLNYEQGKSGWMTGPETKARVHRLRHLYDAIMVGSNTVRVDNPSLTTRLKRGNGRDPIRVILDRTLSLDRDARVFHHQEREKTWVFSSHNVPRNRINSFQQATGARVFTVEEREHRLDLQAILQVLGDNGVTSVLVEGGAMLHGEMISRQLYDYASLFVAPLFAGEEGVPLLLGYSTESKTKAVSLGNVRYRRSGEDIQVEGELLYP